ncbi:hypothetical protein F5051DRAFT_486727 [Lentinula edodes]|nr:hypothetical protein F5051DRAFT_486727 [Lentinula edodes]
MRKWVERKRRYLSFLPPPQVIEICLTFDIHIPASVKATVWPANLDEAIAALQKALDEKSTPSLTYGITQPYAPPPPLPIHPQPQYSEAQSSDEMPGYEDMIVEALNDVQDPEGLAPKDIYTWLINHYRVQANFRPSASQALQKAFKRGRFEKSLSGKYRLNPNCKGGNVRLSTHRILVPILMHRLDPSKNNSAPPVSGSVNPFKINRVDPSKAT